MNFHLRSAQNATVVPQRQLSTGAIAQPQQIISNQLNPPKFVIVKPGSNPVKPNIVVMNPLGANAQVNIFELKVKAIDGFSQASLLSPVSVLL